ncbi:hypothetical protein GQR36_00680 [Enterococcus termitis]
MSIMIRAVFGFFIISFSGVMVYEFTTLSEDVVVIDGVSYVSNVRSQNIKYNIDGVYYEIINDYFVKEPFAFTQKIEKSSFLLWLLKITLQNINRLSKKINEENFLECSIRA